LCAKMNTNETRSRPIKVQIIDGRKRLLMLNVEGSKTHLTLKPRQPTDAPRNKPLPPRELVLTLTQQPVSTEPLVSARLNAGNALEPLSKPRAKPIHDLMMEQELQAFREDVEWRYRNSATNKVYQFPYSQLNDGSDPGFNETEDAEPNCPFLAFHLRSRHHPNPHAWPYRPGPSLAPSHRPSRARS
jgi:hypothetical protein